MDKAQIVGLVIFIAHQNAPKVLQPGKQALDFPASFVASQFAPILRRWLPAVAFVRRNQFNPQCFKFGIQGIRIIRSIANQALRTFVGKTFDESFSYERNFMRRRRRCVDGERKTSAVCHCHELRTLAPLGRADFAAPFLATINVPSIKHSERSSLPRVRKSSAKVSSTRASRPSLTHCWKRRWQVWYDTNLAGRSHQRAPERKIHSTPLRTSRSVRRGRPRVWMLAGLSKSGSSNAHCSSVNSSRRVIS